MKFDLHAIMSHAWRIFRKAAVSFAEALHRAWLSAKAQPINAARIEAARAAAGVLEAVNTWAGWKEHGREVKHGEKALFGCDLIHGSKGDGMTYKARFFAESQTIAIEGSANE